MTRNRVFQVVDFFCGCGGTSAGLRAAGMNIVLGIDFDVDAEATYTLNFPEAAFIRKDIRKITFKEVQPYTIRSRGKTLVFCGCAPCQPFTRVNTCSRKEDDRVDLLSEFGRFVRRFRPDYVVVENVPGIQKPKGSTGPFASFLSLLGALNYDVRFEVISCHHYGVPQTRQRLVLIASKAGKAPWPAPTHGPGTSNPKYQTVWQAINWLPPIEAGASDPTVLNHRAAALSETNLNRIKKAKPGKGRENWPESLKPRCYQTHEGHSDVYGRLHKNRLAAALTTRCISFSNGRFGHPVQHRAISVREAACLQTFDRTFEFRGSLNSMARQIGNAVPVALAREIGKAIVYSVTKVTR